MRKLLIWGFFALCPIAAFASHHVLVLKDGRVVRGTFLSGTSRSITFQDESGARRQFHLDEISSLDFRDSESGTRTESSRSGVFSDNREATDRGVAYREARTGSGYMLPVGAEIAVRTNEDIDSRTATEGRTFDAEIYRDVVGQNGEVIVPRGSDAKLVLREFDSGGTTGSRELVLDLQSVSIRGTRYTVSTAEVERSNERGIGRNRRTAEMVGGGAALGTLLGAIAGGGRGAVIGAIAGAAAGGAAQVLTKGKDVRVPAETVLTFRLDQPLRLDAVGR